MSTLQELQELGSVRAYPLPTAEYYVDADYGSDSADGSYAHPWATLAGARTALRSKTRAGVTLWLRGRRYPLATSLGFTAADSGSPGQPVCWRAYPGERPVIDGGKPLSGWHLSTDARLPEAARGKVWECSLPANGVTDYGTLIRKGWGCSVTGLTQAEIFYKGQECQLARYPEEGEWITITGTPDGSSGNRLTYSDDVPKAWTTTTGIMAVGEWADSYGISEELVSALDAENGVVTLASHPINGITVPGQTGGGRFYFQNVPEALSAPGRYYIDRDTGALLLWPAGGVGDGDVSITLCKDNFVLTFAGTTDFRLEGVKVQGGRKGQLYFLVGAGSKPAARCVVERCDIGEGSNVGVFGYNVRDITIRDCDLHDLGDLAIQFEDDRLSSLTPTNNVIEGNRITRTARRSRMQGAIQLFGVRNVVRGNKFWNLPGAAVNVRGPLHLLEGNEAWDCLNATGDLGVFMAGGDVARRGVTVRDNYVHDLVANRTGPVSAVQLDDFTSGWLIYHNLFRDAGDYSPKTDPSKVYPAVLVVGGGKDNRVFWNVIFDSLGFARLDNRGAPGNWAQNYIRPSVMGVTNATPRVVSTDIPHRLTTGQSVTLDGMLGTCGTELNKAWTVTVADPTHFSLNTSVAGTDYSGGGSVATPWASSTLYTALTAHNYLADPYASAFPRLAQWLTSQPGYATGNVVEGNVYIDISADTSGVFAYYPANEGAEDVYAAGVHDNWTGSLAEAGLAQNDGVQVEFAADSPVWATGFQRLPWELIARGRP